MFAEALHEGPEKAFYFILEDYVERQLQYGLLHHDMTPRPAYLSFAAVGRLLNGASPLGRVDLGDDKLKGYLFKTKVDGNDRETLVAWSETKPTGVDIPNVENAYDYLGRDLGKSGQVQLSRATVYMVLPPGGSKGLKIVAPPAKAAWVNSPPACAVVLQLLGATDFKQSGFLVDKSKDLRLVAYNFGDKPAHGKFSMQGATGPSDSIDIPAGARIEQSITTAGPGSVTVRLDLGDVGTAMVHGTLVTAPPTTQGSK